MTDIIYGKYSIIEELGRGGMGVVYKALQRSLNRIVAIKMLSQELAQNTEFVQRFRQEAVIIAKLDHPNIIRVYDIEECDNTFYIIMEFVGGQSLQRLLRQVGRLDVERALHVTLQALEALTFAHQQGIVHRDIKPDNIMLTSSRQVRVMDFGIAHLAESDLRTMTGVTMGTPKYMSPEQASGRKVDGRTDIYSLGIMLFGMVTGHLPFDGDNPIQVALQHIQNPPPKPSQYHPEIDGQLEAIILRCLAKNPDARYDDGMQLIQAIDQYLEQHQEFKAPERRSRIMRDGESIHTAVSGPGGTLNLQRGAAEETALKTAAPGGTLKIAPDAPGGTLKIAPDAPGGTMKIAPDAPGGTMKIAPDAHGGTLKIPAEQPARPATKPKVERRAAPAAKTSGANPLLIAGLIGGIGILILAGIVGIVVIKFRGGATGDGDHFAVTDQTPAPEFTVTPVASRTPVSTSAGTPTPRPSKTTVPSPTPKPTSAPTPAPTPRARTTPAETPRPTPSVTPAPTTRATVAPTKAPTREPTPEPRTTPAASPTPAPSTPTPRPSPTQIAMATPPTPAGTPRATSTPDPYVLLPRTERIQIDRLILTLGTSTRYDDARREIEQLKTAHPKVWQLDCMIAFIDAKTAYFENRAKYVVGGHFRDAVKFEELWPAHFEYGLWQMQNGDDAEAEKYLRTALKYLSPEGGTSRQYQQVQYYLNQISRRRP